MKMAKRGRVIPELARRQKHGARGSVFSFIAQDRISLHHLRLLAKAKTKGSAASNRENTTE